MPISEIICYLCRYKYNAILNNTQTNRLVLLLIVAALVVTFSPPVMADGKYGLKTVCIDAGHGGKDPGCISKDRKTYESRIVLDIAMRLSEKIKAGYPDVKVVMTRATDTFVSLGGRADIANKANADLFISIHVNTAPGSTAANGYSIHVLGQSSKKNNDLFAYNMDVCKRENSVITLEDDYKTRYEGFDPSDPESFIFFSLMQNSYLEQSLMFASDVNNALSAGPMRKSRGISQNPFYVLWKTAMPAVLVEVGFMSNAVDLASIRSEEGRDKIASGIASAFGVFKKRYDSSVNIQETEKTGQPDKEQASSMMYGIQVLASSKDMNASDPFFRGYDVVKVKSGRIYKYIVCAGDSAEKVRRRFPEVRSAFSGAFPVVVENGNVSVMK